LSTTNSVIYLYQAARPIETVNTTHKIEQKNEKNINTQKNHKETIQFAHPIKSTKMRYDQTIASLPQSPE